MHIPRKAGQPTIRKHCIFDKHLFFSRRDMLIEAEKDELPILRKRWGPVKKEQFGPYCVTWVAIKETNGTKIEPHTRGPPAPQEELLLTAQPIGRAITKSSCATGPAQLSPIQTAGTWPPTRSVEEWVGRTSEEWRAGITTRYSDTAASASRSEIWHPGQVGSGALPTVMPHKNFLPRSPRFPVSRPARGPLADEHVHAPWGRDQCWNCGNFGHKFSGCSQPVGLGRFCFGCGRPNMTKATCPKCSERHKEELERFVSGTRCR